MSIRGRTVTIDNTWIVPYSPILCRSFNIHINVEYCHSVQSIKYICKYLNKGLDQATFGVNIFTYYVIWVKVRQSGKNGLAVASLRIAATLLNYGKTAHSTFKLPLTVSLEQQSVCSIRKNGLLGKLLQETSLIIWDECTMSRRAHVEPNA